MNIILCGTDCTFKTTIAKKLSKSLKLPIVKGSNFETATGTDEELYKFLDGVLSKDGQIIDRSVYSNLVYTSVYPKYTRVTDKQKKLLENKIKENSVVIYLTASVDTIVNRLSRRGDEYVTTNKIPLLIEEYSAVMSKAVKNKVPVHTFDTGVLSSNEIVRQVLNLIPASIINGSEMCDTCSVCGKNLYSNEISNGKYCFGCKQEIMEDLFRSDSIDGN